jgi:hypothetical protein
MIEIVDLKVETREREKLEMALNQVQERVREQQRRMDERKDEIDRIRDDVRRMGGSIPLKSPARASPRTPIKRHIDNDEAEEE